MPRFGVFLLVRISRKSSSFGIRMKTETDQSGNRRNPLVLKSFTRREFLHLNLYRKVQSDSKPVNLSVRMEVWNRNKANPHSASTSRESFRTASSVKSLFSSSRTASYLQFIYYYCSRRESSRIRCNCFSSSERSESPPL